MAGPCVGHAAYHPVEWVNGERVTELIQQHVQSSINASLLRESGQSRQRVVEAVACIIPGAFKAG